MSRLADLLRGATVTRVLFNGKGGWVEPDPSRLDEIMRAATKPASADYYAKAATAADVQASIRKMIGELSPAHPSLRWQVNGTLLACLRADEGVTVCGRRGALTVATEAGIPPCPKCCPGE